MPLRLRLALAVFAFLTSCMFSRAATAGCALPEQFLFVPASGATLPPNPTVLVFQRHSKLYPSDKLDALVVADARGHELQVVREALPAPGATVASLQISAAKGSFTISVRAGTAKASATYRLGHPMSKPKAAVVTDLVEATYAYETGCPPSDGFILHVTPRAMAYEVTAGDQRWIVPDLSGERGVKAGRGVIITGDVGCIDFAIPNARPFALDFTPLFPDGSKGETYSPSCQLSTETAPDGGITHSLRCPSSSGAEFTGKVKRLR